MVNVRALNPNFLRARLNSFCPIRTDDSKTKKPHEIPWGLRDSLSREEFRFRSREGSLAYGSFAVTKTPITVAGPRPNLTAFPASRACNVKSESKLRRRARQSAMRTPLTGSSSSVYVFLPARANLPANLPAGTTHSGKCSSTASFHLSTKVPFRSESLFSPSSAPARSAP